MKVVILDGYVDEPSILGVPPYISPYVRELAGVCNELGVEWEYITIDDWRSGRRVRGDMLVLIGGAVVPGKYLRTYPASLREIREIFSSFKDLKIFGGSVARFERPNVGADILALGDVDALLYDVLTDNFTHHRFHGLDEWNRWLKLGAEVVTRHPDYPEPLVVEIETFRGCPRYLSGGCSFCIEPLYGKPIFRSQEDIVEEMQLLASLGVRNFRIGGQTCIYSYRAHGVGKKEIPEPNVGALESLFKKASRVSHRVLHVDNANPAVIASYPEKGEKITEILVKYTTPGNVVAFGMESADPQVIEKNNLNSTPDDVMEAIKIVNEMGAERGENGMPRLLPGLNFICGLWGERKETYSMNFRFLKDVLERGYLLRRINIRQVASIRNDFRMKYRHECWKFRNEVRRNIDAPMLRRIVPKGTVLRDVYLEMQRGNYTYGRQPGSYPIIVVLPYRARMNRYVDVKIFDYGERSLTGVEYPLNVNEVPYSTLKALPGVGEKKAAEIVRRRPFKSMRELQEIFGEADEYFAL
ncbi:putative Fe-S oxidoreductase [Aciduliprofundum sp. MAR08-339]|uniref:radical SAM protein n=1 Tax=Aciduliprofundum sp. (strain MAR08-339) TaxID=673860 RepID=UPI0002A4AB03|nr:putative Fe-S oxidoreductase [Aciduliprofundum sp. MAR08-339]